MKIVRWLGKLRLAAILVTSLSLLSLAYAPPSSAATIRSKEARCYTVHAITGQGTWSGTVRVTVAYTSSAVTVTRLRYSAVNHPLRASAFLVQAKDDGGTRYSIPRTVRAENSYTNVNWKMKRSLHPYLYVKVWHKNSNAYWCHVRVSLP